MLSNLPWEPLAGAAAAAGAAANQEFAGPEGDAGSDAVEMCEKEALPDCRSVAECLAKNLRSMGKDALVFKLSPVNPYDPMLPGEGYIPKIIAMPSSGTWFEHYVVQVGDQFFDKTHGLNGVSEDELLKIFGDQQLHLTQVQPRDTPPEDWGWEETDEP